MRKINFKLVNEEYTEEIIYNVNDFPYDELRPYKVVSKNKRKYIDKIATFDIETTTIENVSRETSPYGFMYNWQFCIDEKVIMGRTWDEYKEFLNRVTKKLYTSNKKHLVVYVHNLSFEFYEESGNINENIVTVNLNIGTYSPYSKTIDYVVESISF